MVIGLRPHEYVFTHEPYQVTAYKLAISKLQPDEYIIARTRNIDPGMLRGYSVCYITNMGNQIIIDGREGKEPFHVKVCGYPDMRTPSTTILPDPVLERLSKWRFNNEHCSKIVKLMKSFMDPESNMYLL